MGIQTRIITEDNINQIENMSYSNNFRVNARDMEDSNFKLTEIRQLLIQYGFIDRQNSVTRQNIRVEKEDDIYFEKVEDYDLHEFDEPEEDKKDTLYSPETPPYAPNDSPPYAPNSPGYAPGSPGFEPSDVVDFTPRLDDDEFEKFKSEYIKKYPDSHYGEHVVAYEKYKVDGQLIDPENIPEEEIKYGPTLDDIDRYSRTHQQGGKIKMNIGGSNDNLIKVSETNLTFEGGSILQPDNVVEKETKKKSKELEKEMNEISGTNKDGEDENENSDDEDNSGSSSGGGKKILNFELK